MMMTTMSTWPLNQIDNRGHFLLKMLWILTPIATLLAMVRIYTRVRSAKPYYLAVLTMLTGGVYCIVTSVAVHYGYGTHITLFSSGSLQKVTIWIALDVVLGIFLTMVSRVLNLLMINEMMPMPTLSLRSGMPTAKISPLPLCWPLAFISIVPLAWIIVFLSTLNTFKDIRKNGILCHSPAPLINMAYADGAVAALFYTCLAIFPVYRVWQLELSVRKRLTCCFMLGLPIIGAPISIIRCTKLSAVTEKNYTSQLTAYTVLTIIEFNIVTIVSCVGPIRQCCNLILEKITLSGVKAEQDSHSQWYGK